MNKRLKKLRKSLDLTQQEFANRLGVKRNTIATYEIGRNQPIDAVVSLICREFGVNETWLRTGAGEMFQPTPENELAALARKYHLSKRVCALVERFLALSPEIQEAFVDYAVQVAATLADESATAPAGKIVPPGYSSREELEAEARAEAEEYYREILEEKKRAASGSASSDTSTSGTA